MKIPEKTFFTLALALGAIGLLCLTLRLGRVARMVPLWVAIPTSALLVFQSARELYPFPRRYPCPSVDSGLRDILLRGGREGAEEEGEPRRPRAEELRVILWLVSGFAAMDLLGFVVTVPAYIFLAYRVRAGEGWGVSVLGAAGALGATFGMLKLLMPARLMEGRLWAWIGG